MLGTSRALQVSLVPAVLWYPGDRGQNFDADKLFDVFDAAQPALQILQSKGETDTGGEASLRGHLKASGDEQKGSQAYVPPDPKDDKALQMADELLRGKVTSPAFQPKPASASAKP